MWKSKLFINQTLRAGDIIVKLQLRLHQRFHKYVVKFLVAVDETSNNPFSFYILFPRFNLI
jgi:hypothetical protein